jgi:hypothetical protein
MYDTARTYVPIHLFLEEEISWFHMGYALEDL